MPKKQIVYCCKYCTRYSLKSKENVIKHELFCFKNPKNKACKICKFFKVSLRKNQEEVDFSNGNISRCSKLELMFYYNKEGYNTVENMKDKSIVYQRTMFRTNDGIQPFPKKNCDLYVKK